MASAGLKDLIRPRGGSKILRIARGARIRRSADAESLVHGSCNDRGIGWQFLIPLGPMLRNDEERASRACIR